MFETKNGWNISVAGCGFMGVYYIGVGSCLEERASYLLDGATKVCGASSGALFGAVITCKVPMDKTCAIMMEMAKEARRRSIGAMHPAFSLMRLVRHFLEKELPDNAHLLSNGRLGVSLTNVSDGTNLLVTQFDSKEDLIEALICSCFFPPFVGWFPPSFRGNRYIDGAVTDNLPLYKMKNTITIAPFSGECDICPLGTPFYYHDIQYNNLSLHLNYYNIYRVTGVFLPPEPKVLAQMCRDGYRDALRFLHENNLLKLNLLPELSDGGRLKSMPGGEGKFLSDSGCTALRRRPSNQKAVLSKEEEMSTLVLLPNSIEEVIAASCLNDGPCPVARDYLLVRLLVHILMLCILPIEWIIIFFVRMYKWAPEMASDLQWLCGLPRDLYKIYSRSLRGR